MADAFYPFVGEGPTEIGAGADKVENSTSPELGEVVTNPTRIAIFDDPAAAPRVVVIQPSDVRSYLEEITATVTRLAKEQGGKISFTVIRELRTSSTHISRSRLSPSSTAETPSASQTRDPVSARRTAHSNTEPAPQQRR